MTQLGFSHASTGHEPVYHAAHGGLAATLPLTATRLRGRKRLCPVASKKTAGIFAAHWSQRVAHVCRVDLGRRFGVSVLRRLKGDSVIAAVGEPHGVDDPDPDIGQGSHCTSK